MRLQKARHLIRTFAQMWDPDLACRRHIIWWRLRCKRMPVPRLMDYTIRRPPIKGPKTEKAAHAGLLSKAVLGAGQDIVPHWRNCAV